MGLDTIDIDGFADEFAKRTLEVERNAVVAGAVAAFPWLAAGGPFAKIVTEVIGDVSEVFLKYLNDQIGWIAFKFNTTVFTTDQGKDYVASIEKLLKLPDDVSDAEWEKAEDEANRAFRNLVNYRR